MNFQNNFKADIRDIYLEKYFREFKSLGKMKLFF